MDVILEFKRWKLFCLVVGLPVLVQLIGLGVMISQREPKAISSAVLIMVIFFVGVFFAWFFTLGSDLRKKLFVSIKNEIPKV